MRCRHVKALEVGDITDLISDNADDVELLARMLGAKVRVA
jgi:DNA polymerase-3 subunit epsilon